MDGTMYNVLRGLHDQIEAYRRKNRTADKWPDEADAVLAALSQLETVPTWEKMSKAMEAVE